jgi:hypothetical protein
MGNQERRAESGRGAAYCIMDMDMLGLLGGTSILLLFPTNCHGVFLFQFFRQKKKTRMALFFM